jgi:hypothetical protein
VGRARHGRRPAGGEQDQGRSSRLEVKCPTGAEIKSRWKQLVSRLHTGVGIFAAQPSADPGRGDAAFRLFLYSLAIRTMGF